MWRDRRFAGSEQLWVSPPKDAFVRVPDQVLKTAVFLGIDGPSGREYGGTGYIVAVDYSPEYLFTAPMEPTISAFRYPFRFLERVSKIPPESNPEAGEVEEGTVGGEQMLMTHQQATELTEPGIGSFHDPA